MTSDNSEAIAKFQKQQMEKLDEEVPQILQQMDVKILLQYLKGNPNGATVNIINVGKVEGSSTGNGEQSQRFIDRLLQDISMLKAQLEETRRFGVYDYLNLFPQPRFKNMFRSLILTMKEKFSSQKEAAEFLGVSERQFSYWMKTYQIPGYRPRKDYRNEEE